jgi:hypothetical protein
MTALGMNLGLCGKKLQINIQVKNYGDKIQLITLTRK